MKFGQSFNGGHVGRGGGWREIDQRDSLKCFLSPERERDLFLVIQKKIIVLLVCNQGQKVSLKGATRIYPILTYLYTDMYIYFLSIPPQRLFHPFELDKCDCDVQGCQGVCVCLLEGASTTCREDVSQLSAGCCKQKQFRSQPAALVSFTHAQQQQHTSWLISLPRPLSGVILDFLLVLLRIRMWNYLIYNFLRMGKIPVALLTV